MSIKDRENFYAELTDPATNPAPTPNTVSRSLKVGDRSFQTVVFQSGKAILDSEFQLGQDAAQFSQNALNRWQAPSGWFRGQTRRDSYADFITEVNSLGVVADPPGGETLINGFTLTNSFILPRLEAQVAGFPIVVEYTNTPTAGYNVIGLSAPTEYDGTPGTVKRTDFVFLEVWKTLVAPSPKATGTITVIDFSAIVAGDTITVDGGWVLTATAGIPVAFEFLIGATNEDTATNITNAVNDPLNALGNTVRAWTDADTVTLQALEPGTIGNVALAKTSLGLSVSGGSLTGGADRPNKPTQAKLYRHGNTQSPLATWLDDEIEDDAVRVETTQRVQVQYRIRATGATEGVNFKKNPDGFSCTGGGTATIFAQGAGAAPVAGTLYANTATGGGADTITLDAGASAVNGFYTGGYIAFTNNSPLGVAGQIRKITSYDGGTKVASVDTPWDVEPDATSQFQISMSSYPFVPADKSTVWLDSNAAAYAVEDPGLWIAGDGSAEAAIALGTLDGFVYAIPLCFVHRHNDASSPVAATKGFDPQANANGAPLSNHPPYNGFMGAIPDSTSDRPDGHFADVITQENLLDLRRHVMFSGVDTSAELQYQIQSLLDGSTRTWSVDAADKQTLGGTTGDVSTRILVCNEVGRTTGHLGAASTRGTLVREFDHIARRFGDQSVVERVVVAFYPGDVPVGMPVAPGLTNPGKYVVKAGGNVDQWYEDDVLHLDLDSLSAATLGGIFQGWDGGGSSLVGPDNISLFMPPGTVITDVLSVYHDDGNSVFAIEQQVQPKSIVGLGTLHVEVKLDANPLQADGGIAAPNYDLVGSGAVLTASPRRIFVEVEITYPIGAGSTDTFYHPVEPDLTVYNWNADGAGPGPIIEDDVTQRPNDMQTLLDPKFREGFREIHLEYIANDTNSLNPVDQELGVRIGGGATPETLVSRTNQTLYFPRRVYDSSLLGVTSVTDLLAAAPVTVDLALSEIGSSSRKIAVSMGTPLTAEQTLCEIAYYAQDAIPNYGNVGGGYQVAVYFRTNSPQTAGVKDGNLGTEAMGVLPTTLRVAPLYMSPDVFTSQIGSGSQDRAYPYQSPSDQIPINDAPTGGGHTHDTTKEWYFCGTADVTVDAFNASTGMLALKPFVQADGQNVLEFGGLAHPPTTDAEFRAYYSFADDTAYRPTVLSQPLSGAVRHKVLYPFLARAVEEVHSNDGNGLLYRKGEVLLIVLSRFAELDDDNNVRFLDPTTDNRTCAALYRTRNLLLLVGDR